MLVAEKYYIRINLKIELIDQANESRGRWRVESIERKIEDVQKG